MIRAYAEREGITLQEAKARIESVHEFWRDWLLDGNSLHLLGVISLNVKYDATTRKPLFAVRWCRQFLHEARTRLQGFSWDREVVEERDPWRRYTH